MSPAIQALKSRLDTQAGQVKALIERAATENRELTEAEKANADELKRSITFTTEQMESLAEIDRSMEAGSTLIQNMPDRKVVPEKVTSKDVEVVSRGDRGAQIDGPEEVLRSIWPTPGDYLHDVIHAHQGDADSRGRLNRALENETTGDVPGLVPEPIVGDVVNIIDASRPIVSFLRSYTMPQYGSSFTRPKVKQHTEVDVQSAQKTELASRKFLVDPIQVNKVTMGGAIDVAFQVVDWTQPSALNAITDDLADQYAIQTESAMAALILAAAGTDNTAEEITVGSGGVGTADQWIKGIAAAAGAVYANAKRLPNAIFCSPDMWATLIGLTDTTGRPIVAAGSPQNVMGNGTTTSFSGSILGMPLIVSPGLESGSVIVGASQYAEVYEDRRGALRVVEPKLLGWEIAYYGYFAGIVTEFTAFVSLVVGA